MKGVKGFKLVKRTNNFIWPLSWLFKVLTPKKITVLLVNRNGQTKPTEVVEGNLYLCSHKDVIFADVGDSRFYQLLRYRGNKKDIEELLKEGVVDGNKYIDTPIKDS